MATVIKVEESISEPTASSEMNDVKIESSCLKEQQQQQQLSQPGDHLWEQPVVLNQPNTIIVKKEFEAFFPCKICPRKFLIFTRLLSHMEREHPLGAGTSVKYICETCDRKFEEQEELVTHILHLHFQKDDYFIQVENNGVTKYKCKYCGKYENNKSQAEVHEESHIKVWVRTRRSEARRNPFFHCLRCTQRFSQKKLLMDHVRTEHACDTHRCVECGRSFRSAPDLAKHEAYYRLNDKRSNASDAAKVNSQLEDFHSRRFTKFSRSSKRKSTATNEERPKGERSATENVAQNTCTFCPMQFNTGTSFHDHMRKEHGSMMRHRNGEDTAMVVGIDCKICQVLTKLECDEYYFGARQHQITNTFECSICSKKFPKANQLRVHMLFHEEKAWKCMYCQNTYPEVKSLKSHMEEQHSHLKTNSSFSIDKLTKNKLTKNTAVKTENLLNASHQSPLPVEQRTTIFSGAPVPYENSVHDLMNVSVIKCESIDNLETADDSMVDAVGNVEVDKKPKIVVVKSELDDESFTGMSCWQY